MKLFVLSNLITLAHATNTDFWSLFVQIAIWTTVFGGLTWLLCHAVITEWRIYRGYYDRS